MKLILKMVSIALFGGSLSGAQLVAQAVSTDYDHTVNFLKFKSYTLQKVHATDPGVETRITIAVDRDLQARYLHAVDKNPDIIVAVVEANTDANEYTTFYSGLSGLDWQRSWGPSGFMNSAAGVGDIPAGTLVLDIWDGKTHKLIWRGMITEPAAVVADKEADQKMDKAVGQVLGQFPPKYKKP